MTVAQYGHEGSLRGGTGVSPGFSRAGYTVCVPVLPDRAATAANRIALTAATAIKLEGLPFTGSPLNGALRELRFRRAELAP
ncbi:UNVERIFIED_ORG: hypothetical protein ABID57_000789 [Arthrobacter sp. UYEF1]